MSRIAYLMEKETRFAAGTYLKVIKKDHIQIEDAYSGKVIAKIYKDKLITSRKRNKDIKNYAENNNLEYILVEDKKSKHKE